MDLWVLVLVLGTTLPLVWLGGLLALASTPLPLAFKPPKDDEEADDIGSKKKLLRAMGIALVVVVLMSLLLWIMANAEWFSFILEPLRRWLMKFGESAVSVLMTALIILMPLGVMKIRYPRLRVYHVILLEAVFLALIIMWMGYNTWPLANVLCATIAIINIINIQPRASFLRLTIILTMAAVLYDAWQVYGTGNMEKVAMTFVPKEDVLVPPILWIIPSELSWDAAPAGILGLGDIFITGVLLVSASRVGRKVGTRVPMILVLTGYAVGMMLCIFVSVQFDTAQPATIFIVPVCAGAVMLHAKVCGYWPELKKKVYAYNPDLYKREPRKKSHRKKVH